MAKERPSRQNPNFRVIDGERNSFADSMADRIMGEIGDSLPFEIIEGGGTAETVNDRNVRVISLDPKGVLYISSEMITPEKPENSRISFINRIKRIF